MKKLIWIGSYASDRVFNSFKKTSMGQASGRTSQTNIIRGIDKNLSDQDISFDTFNIHGIDHYPVYPQIIIEPIVCKRNHKGIDFYCGFINIKYVKILSQLFSLILIAFRYSRTIKKIDKVYFILYEPVVTRLIFLFVLKSFCHNSITCLIVPDILEYCGNRSSFLFRFLKKIQKAVILQFVKHIDKFVLYSEEMAKYFKLKKSQYTVIEGSVCSNEFVATENNPANKRKVIMYSGSTAADRGVPDFINSFLKLKQYDVDLWITGSSKDDSKIQNAASRDSRIKFYGFMKDRKDVLVLQSKADYLLHIRNPQNPSSNYCFPSKLFEYLLTGKPVISVRINGIPQEYYKYLIVLDGLDTHSVKACLDFLTKMSDCDKKRLGESGRDYVLTQKNHIVQSKKLLDFISV